MAIRVFGQVSCGDPPAPCAQSTALTSDVVAALERVYELRDTYAFAAANVSLGGIPLRRALRRRGCPP